MKNAIGSTAILYTNIQRRRHRHADVAFAGKVCERRVDARTQMCKRYGRTHREAQLRHHSMQCIQNRRGLRDMAEAVTGEGNNEMWHGAVYLKS